MKNYLKKCLLGTLLVVSAISFFLLTNNVYAECLPGDLSCIENVDAAKIISNSDDLSLCPQCTTVWYSGPQAVRFTLVDKSTGNRVPDTISVDYSNEYLDTAFFSDVQFHGFNSKLEYISKEKSATLKSGYKVTRPIGALPRLVGENTSKVDDMNAYLKNTFVNFEGYPTNLLKLLKDLNENTTGGKSTPKGISNMYDYITYYYDNLSDYGVKLEMKTTWWEEMETKFNYAFIVEPVIYLGARTGVLAPKYLPSNYVGKKFAVTATEAALIFPNSYKDCGASVCYNVTHSMLPNSMYLEGTVTSIYFSGAKAQYSEAAKFGFGGTHATFTSNKTQITPYLIKSDVVGPLGKSPGLGIGYFDLIKDIADRCEKDKCGDPDPTIPKCTIDEPDNKPDVPFCRTGNCGTTIAMSDDTNWNNIIGDADHLVSTLGSIYKVTDWIRSDDIFDYKRMSCTEVGNVAYLAPVYCKNAVTSAFPVTGNTQYYAGTHFTFGPIKFDVKKECQTTIEVDKWEKDYRETKKRLSIAEASLVRATNLDILWDGLNSSDKDRDDSGAVSFTDTLGRTATGNLSGGTYCRVAEQVVDNPKPTKTVDTVCEPYHSLSASNTNTTVLSGGTAAAPNRANQYKQEYGKTSCSNYKSGPKLDSEGGPVPGVMVWVADGSSKTTSTTTYTCSYGSAKYSGTSNGTSDWINNPDYPNAYRVALDGDQCTAYKTVGVGEKWTTWSYNFNPSISDEFAEYSKIDSNTSYRAYSSWPLTSQKDAVICKGEGNYQDTVNKYTAAVAFYKQRLKDLVTELPGSINWDFSTTFPSVSVVQKQNTSNGPIVKEYPLVVSGSEVESPDAVKTICTTTACESIKTITGLKEMYDKIYAVEQTIYNYALRENTNQYILKPSGNVVSDLPGNYRESGNYIYINYPNYAISPDSINGFGSGTMTIKYSGMGENNYLGKICGTPGYVCNYQTQLPTPICDGCPPPPPSIKGFRYVYRTIDLNNPFPYTDGTSRQPGYNWRTDPNTISRVITNNRGVRTTEIYDKDKVKPMYTFDFTGSNRSKLMEIRNYNKTHTYKNFDGNITCTLGNACLSSFLDSSIFKNVLSGCGNDTDFNSCYKGV